MDESDRPDSNPERTLLEGNFSSLWGFTDNPPDKLQQALDAVQKIPEIPATHRETVAKEVFTHWDALRFRVISCLGLMAMEPGETSPPMYLFEALAHVAQAKGGPRVNNLLVPNSVDTEAGPVYWQDALAAGYLTEHFGEIGITLGAEVLKRSARNLAEYLGRLSEEEWTEGKAKAFAKLQSLWGLPSWLSELQRTKPDGIGALLDLKPKPPRMLRLLASALWHAKVRPVVCARPHVVQRIMQGRDAYIRIPRSGAAISWTMGGPGRVVEVGGDRYVNSGQLVTRMVPRSWEIVPRVALRPRAHQRNLPIELPRESGRVFVAVAVEQTAAAAGLRGELLTPPAVAGKVLVELFSTLPSDDIVSCSLRDLARELYPEAKALRDRHYRGTAEGLLFCKSLHLVMPDGTGIQCFDVRTALDPATAGPDQVVAWTLGPLFRAIGETDEGKDFRGWFLLNKSGFMRLDNRKPRLQAHYIRAAASWNDAHDPGTGNFNQERVEPYSPEAWGGMTNTLSQRTAEYICDKTGKDRRRDLSADKKAVQADLVELADGYGLIRLERAGRGRFRILPPETYLEAWEKARSGRFVAPGS